MIRFNRNRSTRRSRFPWLIALLCGIYLIQVFFFSRVWCHRGDGGVELETCIFIVHKGDSSHSNVISAEAAGDGIHSCRVAHFHYDLPVADGWAITRTHPFGDAELVVSTATAAARQNRIIRKNFCPKEGIFSHITSSLHYGPATGTHPLRC